MQQKIDSFTGEYRFLSNFWTGNPFPFGTYADTKQPLIWPTAEHLFQAQKATLPGAMNHVRCAMSPGGAKRRGRQLKVRADWETYRITAMIVTLGAKFRDPEMMAKLLATGDAELIEGNTWGDTFWGVCGGTGENMLGRLLMDLRTELREKADG